MEITTMYDRLERDTSAERKRFMEIPIVKMLLNSEDAEGGTPSPEEQGYLKSVYERFLVESYYHVRAASKVYALAGSRISEGDESIREWLLQHAIDEYGHHHWVIDDLRTLHYDAGLRRTAMVALTSASSARMSTSRETRSMRKAGGA